MSYTTTPSASPGLPARRVLHATAPALVLALAALAGMPGAASAQAAPPAGTQCPAGWAPVPPGVNPALRCLPQSLIASLPPQSGAPDGPANPNACPAGWRPVAPEVNPVLRCQPDRRSSGKAPAEGKPAGCPAGWTTVPPGVNPVLRCLPANIAPLARPQRAAPTGCPKGWKPVEPGMNPLMRCVPGSVAQPGVDPLPGGPGTGDPGQGRDTQAQLAARDLALVDGFRIGTATLGWGSIDGVLPASTAAFRQNGACGFRYVYRTRNAGLVGTPATSNRVHRDTQAGPVLATSPLAALAPGAIGTSSGHVLLKPGTWMLYAHADAAGLVTESNEANNLRRVRVTVTGSCAG